MKRNYIDPQYKNWRASVRKRDGYKCRMPGCEKRCKLQVHHIKRWTDYPFLRYDINNGITLCKQHHRDVTGREEAYEALFTELILQKVEHEDSFIKVLRIIRNAQRRR